MFSGWQSLFQMTGEAAATLTGLLFIVVTLTAGRPRPRGMQIGSRFYTTPTVFHFATVLAISAMALAPAGEGPWPAALMLAWSLAGLACALHVTVGILRLPNHAHWSDIGWYGLGPLAAHAALALACGGVVLRLPHAALGLALTILALLLVATRNAWDLATWLAQGPSLDQEPEA
ncbi:hypothetical protein ACO2Q3_04480 [Caulobacter sp. KR2-114]|uniref:hypothetical protein n=1 Tax=Caulobacter sp. KR2-114 TaxID=3400912 RepID=UPI003C04DE77